MENIAKKQERGIGEYWKDSLIPISHVCLKLGREVQVCNHSSGEPETDGFLDPAGQTTSPPQWNHVSKSKQTKPENGWFSTETSSEVLLWLPPVWTNTSTHIYMHRFKKSHENNLKKTVCGIWGDTSHGSCYVFKTIILEMGCVEKLGSCSSERSEWNRIIFKPTHMARGLPDWWCKFSVSSIRKGTSFFAVWGMM